MVKEFVSTREATINDIPLIRSMHQELSRYCSYPRFLHDLPEARVERAIADNSNAQSYYVADDYFEDGYGSEIVEFREVAGFIHLGRAALSFTGRRGVYVDDLYVRPELQHSYGVGISLLARAAWLAIETAEGDVDRAFLRIDTANGNNDPHLRRYEGLGFEGHNTQLHLRGEALKELANRALTISAPGTQLYTIS